MHAERAGIPDGLEHTSRTVWCPRRASAAVIHVVERHAACGTLRSIVWCSLRDADQCCDEHCLP